MLSLCKYATLTVDVVDVEVGDLLGIDGAVARAMASVGFVSLGFPETRSSGAGTSEVQLHRGITGSKPPTSPLWKNHLFGGKYNKHQ